jgi:SulP family sulfate permease
MTDRNFDKACSSKPGDTGLLVSFTAGIVAGTITVIAAMSFAALIFSGDLADNISAGIGMALFSAVIAGSVLALFSSFPGMIGHPSGHVAPIIALMAGAIVGNMPAAATDQQIFATVFVAIGLATLISGIFLYLIGRFKIGGLIQFIPYPVIGGFLAGTGWLLAKGSIGVMTGINVNMMQLPELLRLPALIQWIPGAAFAVLLLLLSRRFHHFLLMPVLLVSAVAAFYLVLLLADIPPASARAQGWLLGPLPSGGLWRPIGPSLLFAADWWTIFGQTSSIGTILLVSAVSVLLNSSALELAADQDIDLDREMQTAGAANILIGMGGGMVGLHSLSMTGLALKMGSRSRLSGLISASICLVVLFLGASIFSFFPKAVMGGLLLFIGLSFLTEWLYEGWFKLPRADYLAVVLILTVVSTAGYLEGVGVGLIVAIIMFVVNYSQIDVVKHELSGAEQSSNVDRSVRHNRVLRDKVEQILILKLQGYIFFGTASGLLNRVHARAEDRRKEPLQFVVLDFQLVNGLDTSAAISFIRMKRLAETLGFTMVFCHLGTEIRHLFSGEILNRESGDTTYSFSDLDHAMEWCENQILLDQTLLIQIQAEPLREQLAELIPDIDVDRLMAYMEREEVEAGYRIIRQGDPAAELFFVESGRVTAKLELDQGEGIRLRTMGPGTVVGELALYLKQSRSASVIADKPSVIYRLSSEALQTLAERDRDVAAAFHQFMARLLAERLVHTNTTLKTLLH